MDLRTHRVKPGETLATLSNAYYGKPDFALIIYEHNRHTVRSPNQIFPGQVLIIPYIPVNAAIYG